MVMTYPTVMTNMLPVTGAWPCAISKCKATSVPYSKATSKTLIRSGSSINEIHSLGSIRRVLVPRSALATRNSDIDRARARIASCESDGQARCRPT
jgi:hypothetical protein